MLLLYISDLNYDNLEMRGLPNFYSVFLIVVVVVVVLAAGAATAVLV
jgi:hypothetical protein